MLAQISVKWYTLLEQGRALNCSTELIKKVSELLRLTRDEQDYLFRLLRKAESLAPQEDNISKNVLDALRFLPVPTVAITLRWDILYWNSLMAKVFQNYGAVPPEKRNLLRTILTRKGRYHTDSYERMVQALLAKFRFDFSMNPDDASFETLVTDFKRDIPDFACRWSDVEVSNSLEGRTVVVHEEFGELVFDRSSYVPEGNSCLRVVMFTPCDQRTRKVISALKRTTHEPTRRLPGR